MSEEFDCVDHAKAYRDSLEEAARNWIPPTEAELDALDPDEILTAEDKAALEALGDNLVEKLIKRVNEESAILSMIFGEQEEFHDNS
jgi:hypothetical protein